MWTPRPVGLRRVLTAAASVVQRFHPQGFGVAARSTVECRKLDPTAIVAFHQADVGEYLRAEDTLT